MRFNSCEHGPGLGREDPASEGKKRTVIRREEGANHLSWLVFLGGPNPSAISPHLADSPGVFAPPISFSHPAHFFSKIDVDLGKFSGWVAKINQRAYIRAEIYLRCQSNHLSGSTISKHLNQKSRTGAKTLQKTKKNVSKNIKKITKKPKTFFPPPGPERVSTGERRSACGSLAAWCPPPPSLH